MAHFLGTVKGRRGKASRLGSKSSGLETVAASWEGAVKVELVPTPLGDWVTVSLIPWHDRGTHKIIYEGPVSHYHNSAPR